MNRHLKMFAFVALIATFLGSCKEDLDLKNMDTRSEVEMGLAIPIGSMTATIGDFLGHGQVDGIYVGTGGLLYFRDTFDITRTFHNINLEEKVSRVNKHFYVLDQLSGSDMNPDGTVKTGKPIMLKFPFSMKLNNINTDIYDERIDSALIDKSRFFSTITTSDWDEFKPEYIDSVEIVLGDEFHRPEGKRVKVCSKGDFAFNSEIPIDINEFVLNLMKNTNLDKKDWYAYQYGNAKDSCNMEIRFHFTIPAGDKVHVTANTRYNYHLRVQFIDFIAVWGFFRPSSEMRDADTVLIEDEWEKWRDLKKAKLPFDTPNVYMNIESKIAGAMNMHGKYLYVKSLQTNDSIYASFAGKRERDVFYDGKGVGRDYLPLTSAIGDSIKYTTIVFDERDDRGQIDKLFAIRPDILGYQFYIDFDSLITPQIRVLRNSNITVKADIDAAFQFKKGLEASYIDTISDVKLSKYSLDSLASESDFIDTIKTSNLHMVLAFENKIPLRIKGVFRFMDDQNQIIMDPDNPKRPFGVSEKDTILITAPGIAYSQGEAHIGEPGKTVYTIAVSRKHFDTLTRIKNIEFYAELDAEQMDPAYKNDPNFRVKIKKDDQLKIRVGVSANVDAVFNFTKEDKK